MKPEEYRLIMRNLELHYQDFMRDSQDSKAFGPDDRMQIEEDYTKCTQHFDNLLRSMEKGNMCSENTGFCNIIVITKQNKGICIAPLKYKNINSPFSTNGR